VKANGTAKAPVTASVAKKKATSTVAQRKALGHLNVETNPPGLWLRVAGLSFGATPTVVTLPAGRHVLQLRDVRRGINYGHPVTVEAGEKGSVQVRLRKGTLAFKVRPYADVSIDGKRIGLTPLPPVDLYEGVHRIRFVNESLKRSVLRQVRVTAGRRATLTVDMERER
jgi:serine/threonine-protein kinase